MLGRADRSFRALRWLSQALRYPAALAKLLALSTALYPIEQAAHHRRLIRATFHANTLDLPLIHHF